MPNILVFLFGHLPLLFVCFFFSFPLLYPLEKGKGKMKKLPSLPCLLLWHYLRVNLTLVPPYCQLLLLLCFQAWHLG